MNKGNSITHVSRLEWLDVAKSIAIILMVLGHSSIPQYVSNYIFAFHMPLFFIASGLTTNWNNYTFGQFFKRRCLSLILPFFIYSAIVLMIYIQYDWMTFSQWLQKGWGDGYALWFIPVLFFASLTVKCLWVFRDVRGVNIFWLAIILILIVGIDFYHFHIRLPWALSTVPYATFLIALGSELGVAHKGTKLEISISKNNQILSGLTAAFIVGLISHFWRLDLCFNIISPAFPLTIGAITGTYMIFMLSIFLCNTNGFKHVTNILRMIGQETYIVVAFSPIIIILINHYVIIDPILKYGVLLLILVLLCIVKNYIKIKVKALVN